MIANWNDYSDPTLGHLKLPYKDLITASKVLMLLPAM